MNEQHERRRGRSSQILQGLCEELTGRAADACVHVFHSLTCDCGDGPADTGLHGPVYFLETKQKTDNSLYLTTQLYFRKFHLYVMISQSQLILELVSVRTGQRGLKLTSNFSTAAWPVC